ncbi:collagen-like protein [Nocardia sp. CNY236]|uniref:collagen-like protein n=1 Tax=Nocardia sp. CNY236 TaxID=1169152 RepID=UPI0004207865|nr:collagen-like protein [Nocardia sp. CNY236]
MSTDDAETPADDTNSAPEAPQGGTSAAKVELTKETDSAAEEVTPMSTRPRRSGVLVGISAIVAGVLCVAAINAAVIFFLQSKDRNEKLDAMREATDAACKFATEIASYDYSSNLEDWFASIRTHATGEFLEGWDSSAEYYPDLLVEGKAKAWADNIDCGYQSGDKTSAKVLVSVKQHVVNFSVTTPVPVQFPAIAEMRKSGNEWLVEKFGVVWWSNPDGVLPGGPALGGGAQLGSPEQPAEPGEPGSPEQPAEPGQPGP